jgi:pimeloyl-ACP methyl ester carboxylesterase
MLFTLPGYPTSSFDYARVVDRLAAHGRVYVHDHLGFGLSGTFVGSRDANRAIMTHTKSNKVF